MSAAAVAQPRWRFNLATVRVLAAREVVRFFRQRSRVIGALAQPIVFWFVLGSGFAGSFRLRGGGVGYLQFFFPGVVSMILLFSAIFATITLIEDRREGFLQCVLAGPGSRLSVVIGKSLGTTAIALLQACLFLLLAPLAHIPLSTVNWPLLGAVMVFSALALTGVGFAMAWWINSTTGYHAVMSILLVPAWVLSGAMFPIEGAGPVLAALMRINPMRFAVDGLRQALLPGVALASPAAEREVVGLVFFAAIAIGVSAWRVSRRE